MHPEARAFVASVAMPGGAVLEVGSRHINGGVRDLLEPCDYYGLDLEPGPGVDEVADVTTWTTERRFDTVLCCEVLEHAPEPEQVVRACIDLLAPEGRLILTAACDPRAPHSGHDGAQVRPLEHYRNVDPLELFTWTTDLRDCELEVHPRGDVYLTGLR